MISRETLWAEAFMQQRLWEAEHERLIRQARPPRKRREPGYRRTLARLGQRLVRWGLYLHPLRQGPAVARRSKRGQVVTASGCAFQGKDQLQTRSICDGKS